MAGTKPKHMEGQRASSDGGGVKPGAALQAIRTQKGLTLAEMSLKTGLPVSTLSKIENDKMSLTYDKLARISTALEIDIGQLFTPQAAPGLPGATVSGRRSIMRAGEGQPIETGTYHYLYQATDLLKKHFVPIIGELYARTIEEFGELIRHPGEEYAYVLEGAVEFHTDLYAPVLLKAGDSIYFDSGMGHAYLAGAPGPCRLLAICSGPDSQVIEAALKNQRSLAPAPEPATEPQPPKPRAGRKRAERN